MKGASQVVISDFPDPLMIANTEYNVRANLGMTAAKRCTTVIGHVWGSSTDKLMVDGVKFDCVLMSDLLYELEHQLLLHSCCSCLAPTGVAWVAFQLHDATPNQATKQLAFFKAATAESWNLCVEKMFCVDVLDPLSKDYGLGEDPLADQVHVYKMAFDAAFL